MENETEALPSEGTHRRREGKKRGGKKRKKQRLDATQAQGVRGGDKGREVNPGKPAQRHRCCRGRKDEDGGGNADSQFMQMDQSSSPWEMFHFRTSLPKRSQVLPVAVVQTSGSWNKLPLLNVQEPEHPRNIPRPFLGIPAEAALRWSRTKSANCASFLLWVEMRS